MYSVNQWIDYNGPPGFDYFTCALELLPDVHEEGTILFVETLALVGYLMQNLNRRDAAFLYIGMALRMAITLGLHAKRPSTSTSMKPPKSIADVPGGVFTAWGRIHSVKSGNPITVYDEDTGVALPSKLPHEPEYCPAAVLKHYTKLSQICGEITVSIYRRTPKSGSTLMAAVKNIVLSLSQWHHELPEELRFDPARLSVSREFVSTLLHYSQCINMTARPLLFHVVQKRLKAGLSEKEEDWKQGLTQTTIKVIEMCISASRDTVNMMMSIAAQKNLVATYGYMDSEHAFSAAVVLVMVWVSFPTHSQNEKSMDSALELLCGMSHRGNSHVAARYELLECLKIAFLSGSSDVAPTMTGRDSPLSAPVFDMSLSLGHPAAAQRASPLSIPIPDAVTASQSGLHVTSEFSPLQMPQIQDSSFLARSFAGIQIQKAPTRLQTKKPNQSKSQKNPA